MSELSMQEASHLSFPEIIFQGWLLSVQALAAGLLANYLSDQARHDRTRFITYAVALQGIGVMIVGWVVASQMPLDPKALQQHPAYLIRGMLWLQAGGLWGYGCIELARAGWRSSLAVLAVTGFVGIARIAGWSEAPDPSLAELFRNSSLVALVAVGPIVYGRYL